MLSPAPLLSEIRSSRCQEADSSPKGPTATLGSDVTGLRSLHRRYRWKALGTLDSTAQETADSNTGCALTRRLKIRCAFTLLHAPPCAKTPLCHVLPTQSFALISFLWSIFAVEVSLWLKVKFLSLFTGDQIRRIFILFVPFASIAVTLLIDVTCVPGILQRSAALTASESVPSSDAASFDPVSLTTPTYSIADLQALFSQVQALSSSASNSALSVTPGISSEWFLDSACCNHMTDNPHLTSAHTPPVLPTITTADGSAMTDSRTGQIVGSARKVGRLFELTSLHFPSSSVSTPVIAASASIELWHSRLGHVSLPHIQTLVSRGLLGSVSSSPFDCMPCQLGKQPALPFNNSESIASATFDLIHSDVWGPSPVPTTQYSKAIKVFRSDNAREYRQTDFSTILKHYGTIFHTSCAGTSQQNGRAERKLRHILDTVRALTNAASTPVLILGALNFNPALSYVVFLAMALKKRGNSDSQADPLPNLFPEIPSPSAESVNPISDESPPADPSSDESPTADPTFDESPLSAPAANPASSDPLWQQAMKEELDALLKTGTWDLVDLPAGKSAIGCKWVYKIKTRSDGTVDRYKARLVAKGFTQEYGIDYEETFAPVARLSSVRTLIAVSASRHWPLFQMDVKNAFLNGELTEEVYMQLPPGFSQPPGFSHKVCRLRRALYGLKQAPRAWFAKFSSTISQHGFSASSYDSALFFRRSDHGITLLLLYVDDMIITGDDVQGIQDLKHFLGQHFEMKDLGPLSYFLGLEVSSSSDGYYLTQAKYTSDLISRAGITDSKIVDTPIEYNNRLNTHDGEPLPDATLYRQLVGSLVYLTVTRPDISYAVHIVSQFMAAPRSLHYAAVLRILRLILMPTGQGIPTDRRSTTGYCFLLGDSLISWRSKKQSVVARSSTEAEYRALADTTAELLWLRWLLQDLGIDCSTAVPIHCDNRSAIQIAHNDVFHERTKHIEIDCHFIRHHLLQGTLQLRSVSSQDQLADIFTKPMPPGRFRDFISNLKLVSLNPT
uniref:Integrase catalytic domain-containing protein n=1 Tax=Fagus sylvatica TaxID=28930 RepID=A0A2N9HJ90_FAGSY